MKSTLNKLKTCKYCNKEFSRTSTNQVYCSPFCSTRMAKIKKTLRQKASHNTLVPRRCKLCGKLFKFHRMKKNCKDCLKLLKDKPYLYRTNLIK